MSHL
ncbi:hypothetical protein F383_11373 [Gossypium arboreum]